MVLPVRPGDIRDAADLFTRLRSLGRRFLPDHATMVQRRFRGDAWYSGGFYVVVVVAPARRVTPVEAARLGPLAVKLAAQAWPTALEVLPMRVSGDLARFEAKRDGEGDLDAAVEIRATGLVETLWRVPDDSGDANLSVVDVLERVGWVLAATRTPAHEELTRRRRRLDWRVNLTSWRSGDDGAIPWSGLICGGGASPRRASEASSFSPVGGFAPDALRGRRRTASAEELLGDVVEDLLVQNGYFDFGDAAGRLASEAWRRVSGSRPPPAPGRPSMT